MLKYRTSENFMVYAEAHTTLLKDGTSGSSEDCKFGKHFFCIGLAIQMSSFHSSTLKYASLPIYVPFPLYPSSLQTLPMHLVQAVATSRQL